MTEGAYMKRGDDGDYLVLHDGSTVWLSDDEEPTTLWELLLCSQN